jgi:hypothetical protein
MTLSTWHQQGARKSCTLTMYGANGALLSRYKLTNARVSKYETVAKVDGFTLKQQVAPMTLEKITIVCERIDRV